MAPEGADVCAPCDVAEAAASQTTKEYLIVFAHSNMYFNMRFQELESICSMHGVTSREELYVESPPPTALTVSPFTRVRLPGGDATARAICERSVLVKAILDVWGEGTTFTDAVANALAKGDSNIWRQHIAPPKTFQIRVSAFGKNASLEHKNEVIQTIDPLFQGDEVADLQKPDCTVWAFEEHDHHSDEKTHLAKRQSEPLRTFICRQVAGGRSIDKKKTDGDLAYTRKYNLDQRAVLGPTTMENELAFIMANCACASKGKLSIDPFCGTGGLLVAVSHFGARVYGSELDMRVIKGWRIAYVKNKKAAQEVADKRQQARAVSSTALPASDAAEGANAGYPSEATGKVSDATGKVRTYPGQGLEDQKDIFTNFWQYGFEMPEIVICDNSMRPWREPSGGWIDCIVTDPPYGVRAGMKKSGRKDEDKHIPRRQGYIPSKINYGEDELNQDLMDFAARALTDNGRMTYLLPLDLAPLLGIDRFEVECGGNKGKGTLRDKLMPDGGRKKDKRLVISETTRDPLLLDETRYLDYLPQHTDLELMGASLQILSGGLGRVLVTMRRRPRT